MVNHDKQIMFAALFLFHWCLCPCMSPFLIVTVLYLYLFWVKLYGMFAITADKNPATIARCETRNYSGWHVSYLVPHLTSFENSNLNHPNYCSSLKSMNSVHTHLHGKTHVCFFEPSPEPIMTWRKCQELQRTGPPHQPSLSVWYHQPSTSTQTQFSPRGCSGGPTTFKNSPWYFPMILSHDIPMIFPLYHHDIPWYSHINHQVVRRQVDLELESLECQRSSHGILRLGAPNGDPCPTWWCSGNIMG